MADEHWTKLSLVGLLSMEGLDSGPRLTWWALSAACGVRGECYLSLSQLAALTGDARRTLTRHIATLEDAGWLTVDRNGRVPVYHPRQGGTPQNGAGSRFGADAQAIWASQESEVASLDAEMARAQATVESGATRETIDKRQEKDGRSEDRRDDLFLPSRENLRFSPSPSSSRTPDHPVKDSYSHDDIARRLIPTEILDLPGFRRILADILANGEPGDRWGIRRDSTKAGGWARFPDYD